MRFGRCSMVVFAIGVASAAPIPQQADTTSTVALVRVPDRGIQPQAAVDAAGRIHVLYFKGEAAHGDLFYARLGNDGALSQSVQVNAQAGSAVATGTMRGGHLALGQDGRIHVAWHGSDLARPRAMNDATPVLYTRSNVGATTFEPERNVVQRRLEGLDGGTVASDATGNVYVAWHAFEPGLRGEDDRRVWMARSTDNGTTFSAETAVSSAETGACGCCGVGALADQRGLYVLYRSAKDVVHRDTYLLTSRDQAKTFSTDKLQEWNIGACPMSTFSFTKAGDDVLTAWETDGQVQWMRVNTASGVRSATVTAPGTTPNRKHPTIASNAKGDVLLAWTEGTGWNRGGSLAWQVFDKAGKPVGPTGRADGVPVWSLAAATVRTDGRFVIIY